MATYLGVQEMAIVEESGMNNPDNLDFMRKLALENHTDALKTGSLKSAEAWQEAEISILTLPPSLHNSLDEIDFEMTRLLARVKKKGTKSVTVNGVWAPEQTNEIELSQHIINTALLDIENYLIIDASKYEDFTSAYNTLVLAAYNRLKSLIIKILKDNDIKYLLIGQIQSDNLIDQDLFASLNLNEDEGITNAARMYAQRIVLNGTKSKPVNLQTKLTHAMHLYKNAAVTDEVKEIEDINPVEVISGFRDGVKRMKRNFETQIPVFGITEAYDTLQHSIRSYLNNLNSEEAVQIIFASQKIKDVTIDEFVTVFCKMIAKSCGVNIQEA